jgi:hypothetical protein
MRVPNRTRRFSLDQFVSSKALTTSCLLYTFANDTSQDQHGSNTKYAYQGCNSPWNYPVQSQRCESKDRKRETNAANNS